MKHQAYKQNYCIQIHTKENPKILKLITPKQGVLKVYHVKFELIWANGTMSMKINKNRHNFMLHWHKRGHVAPRAQKLKVIQTQYTTQGKLKA